MEAAIKTRQDKYDHTWLKIWSFYQDLMKERNLTAYDILKQLDMPCSYVNLEYLSSKGDQRRPSTKPGTTGREIWDGLLPGLQKTDWLPAIILTYEEKFNEMKSNGYFHQYDVNFLNDDQLHPLIEVIINHEEYYDQNKNYYNYDKNDLIRLLTINGMIPEIKTISHSFWL